jgi:hypothetical protein
MEQKCLRYFISGHIDLSQEQFDKFYKDRILKAIASNGTFVMGSAPGADYMAQQFLYESFKHDPTELDRMIVYHRGDNPETQLIDSRIKTIGGFKSHNAKDTAMTKASDMDIAYVRSYDESKILYGEKFNPHRISGTQQNLNRREKINKQKIY